MKPVNVQRGDSPVVIAFPHSGTHVPASISGQLTPLGQSLADTDWHVDQLYDGLLPEATRVRANFHRYVIDANRDPSGASLYPGQNTTGLVPLTDFDGSDLWIDAPNETEIERRCAAWHAPYHAALAAELEQAKARHGVAILFDAHSIRSRVPYLFEGVLPDFNIGTNNGATCDRIIEKAAVRACGDASAFTMVLNGRFKGGWTTRHYGRPETGVHAIQMELAQSTYLDSEAPPYAFDQQKAERVRKPLAAVLNALTETALLLRDRP